MSITNNLKLLIPTVITLPFHFDTVLPQRFQADDARYPKSLVEYFILKFTQSEDIVFDPFAGYGTTLLVSKKLGRRVIGTEIDPDKVEYLSHELILDKEILLGDVRQLIDQLPQINFVMTSPPYASKDEKLDPFSNYKEDGNYDQYLSDIKHIFDLVKSKMRPNSYAIIEVANLKNSEKVTTLAWDIGKTLSNVFEFKGEIIVSWQAENKPEGNYGYGYDHSYCLVFLTS